MSRPVSWPMYAVDPAAVAGFWTELRGALVESGLAEVPGRLTEPGDLLMHWRDPALLLSQTCGFPFATSLAGEVRYVATPRFSVPGCRGALYCSAIVLRNDEPARGIEAMAGRRAAFNSDDSQSGYNALRALVAPHAKHGRFFGGTLPTGSHRASIRAVASGAADLAAIDIVTWHLWGACRPDELAGLRVLCHTPAVPGLPFVTSAHTTDADLASLRHAVASACGTDTAATRALRLDGTEELPPHAYDPILAMRDDAIARGYSVLA